MIAEFEKQPGHPRGGGVQAVTQSNLEVKDKIRARYKFGITFKATG